MTQQHYSQLRKTIIYPYKDLYTNVNSGIIHNSQKRETIQMPTNQKIDEETIIYPLFGILCSNKTELLIHATLSKRSHIV